MKFFIKMRFNNIAKCPQYCQRFPIKNTHHSLQVDAKNMMMNLYLLELIRKVTSLVN